MRKTKNMALARVRNMTVKNAVRWVKPTQILSPKFAHPSGIKSPSSQPKPRQTITYNVPATNSTITAKIKNKYAYDE